MPEPATLLTIAAIVGVVGATATGVASAVAGAPKIPEPRLPPPIAPPAAPPPSATDVIDEATRDAQRAASEERARQRALRRRRPPSPAQATLGSRTPLG